MAETVCRAGQRAGAQSAAVLRIIPLRMVKPMIPPRVTPKILILVFILTGLAGALSAAQKKQEPQLPKELKGAKVFNLPQKGKDAKPPENPAIYKQVTYGEINMERLVLKLFMAIKPVERTATVRRIYFQDIKANGIPLHIETFDQEFKLSKKDPIDLPGPLNCTVVFAELDSLLPLKQLISENRLVVTGQSFIEVKLNAIEKLAVGGKQVVLPVPVNETVPFAMFEGNPFVQMAVTKILDMLADPSSAAAMSLAKEHLARLTAERTFSSIGKPSLYLLYCEYALVSPETKASEKFSQSGTGFLVSTDGKLLTAKRTIEPWKFNPEIAYMMSQNHLELDPKSVKLAAWPVDAQVLTPAGQPDLETALSTENQKLQVLKTAPDQMENQEYQDPDSGESATLSLHVSGQNDVAVLQLTGKEFVPLVLAEAGTKPDTGMKTTLYGFPFGLNQKQAQPRPLEVKADAGGQLITLERQLNPGESGAPLLTPEGRVLGLAGGKNECIPIDLVRSLLN